MAASRRAKTQTLWVETVVRDKRDTFRVPDSFHAFEPILLFALVLVGFVITNLIIAHTIGPHRRTAVKDMPYESGMDPIADARQPFDVKFSLVAILFLIFDVELLFLFPWAVSAYADEGGVPSALRQEVFWVMIAFVATLIIPYVVCVAQGCLPMAVDVPDNIFLTTLDAAANW